MNKFWINNGSSLIDCLLGFTAQPTPVINNLKIITMLFSSRVPYLNVPKVNLLDHNVRKSLFGDK